MSKILLIFLVSLSNCNAQTNEFKPKTVYKSRQLVITQISENSFVHTSFLKTQSFGNVPCNGLIVRNNNETVIFDSPTNDVSSEELIKWITNKLHSKINAIFPTHFHEDCLGGLKVFHKYNIPSFANFQTIELAKEKQVEIPQNGFNDSLIFEIGDELVVAKYFGEGHTKDNIIGYFPKENILFGGCLIKELNAGKGYLGDANVIEWSMTVAKVKTAFPNAKIVIPGHGDFGGTELFDFTINLFKTE